MKTEKIKLIITFLLGGVIYGIIEIAFRSYTHPTMFFAGGICTLFITRVARLNISYPIKMLLSGIFITVIEFAFGVVFNILLKQNVWDYSDMPFNLLGQICPLFFVLWIGLSGIAIIVLKELDRQLSRKIDH